VCFHGKCNLIYGDVIKKNPSILRSKIFQGLNIPIKAGAKGKRASIISPYF
jgi:hypothetical protein